MADAEDLQEPRLETAAGKAYLMETKRKALTEEVFVEAKMLQAPDSFDKLMEMITGRAPASLFRLVNVDMNWVDAIASLINSVERLQKLFDVFRDGNAVARVKVVFCLKRLWETRVFESFLTQMLERCATEITALMDLYNVAVILSFEVPNSSNFQADIFPYGPTASQWVAQHCEPQVEPFVRSVMCSYYIRIIHNIFMMNAVTNMHHIKPILSKYNQLHQSRVGEVEGGMGRLFDEALFPLITSARSSACALGVFLVVQMLSTKNQKLEAFAKQYDFLTPLRKAARDYKYTHTKWACSHLMKMLLSGTNLLDFALPFYVDWYTDATAPGDFDMRSLRFRFAYEFAHAILRDGFERGCPADQATGRKEEHWESPLRHALVLRCALDGLSDLQSPNRVLRCVSVLRLLVQEKWTTKKDVVQLLSMPQEWLFPRKRSVDPLSPREHLTGSGAHHNKLHKKGSKTNSFFRIKLTSSKKETRPHGDVDNQRCSELCCLGEKIMLHILEYLSSADLLVMSSVCWRLHNMVYGMWKSSFQHEVLQSSMRPAALTPVALAAAKKPQDEQLMYKGYCKMLCRAALPNVLYRVVLTFSHAGDRIAAHSPDDVTRSEAVVTCLKMLGYAQRCTLWWNEMDHFIESHWMVMLLQMVHRGESLDVNKAAWRLWYQLLAYHPGMVDRLISHNLLEPFLKPVDARANPVVVFNALYYLTKLLANDPPTAEHRKRMARKDVQTLAAWIKDADIWPQWHAIYAAYHADPRNCAFVFPSLAGLFAAVNDSFLCKKLKAHLHKNADYDKAIAQVRDLMRGKKKDDRQKDDSDNESSQRGSSAADPPAAVAAAPTPNKAMLQHDDAMPLVPSKKGNSQAVLAKKPTSAEGIPRLAPNRGVTASGVKVLRDIGRLGVRAVDVGDGCALIRRNSDPEINPHNRSPLPQPHNGMDAMGRRMSSPN